MENKQMEVQQPSFGVPIGLQYRLSIADAVPSSHNISQFLASNASNFTPSNNTIRINVSSGAFLDLKNAVLEFDLKNTTGTDPCRLDGGAGCVINRIRILSSDGSEIERIDSYNLLDCVIDQYTSSDGDARIKSAQKGAPLFSDDTPAFDAVSNTGSAAGTSTATLQCYETGLEAISTN